MTEHHLTEGRVVMRPMRRERKKRNIAWRVWLTWAWLLSWWIGGGIGLSFVLPLPLDGLHGLLVMPPVAGFVTFPAAVLYAIPRLRRWWRKE